MRGGRRVSMLVCLLLIAGAERAGAQLGSLLSPGRLARPHAELEGIGHCTKCHEQGRRVTAAKCLACHKPVAERIARKAGVHRDVTGECITCHAEHAGIDGHLRPFDQSGFDHAGVTLFPLDGKHAPLKLQCAACHKGRSFLTVQRDCASCHRDVHKGLLGTACQTCHSPQFAFKDVSRTFDHARAKWALNGAHAKVPCGKCHQNGVYRGMPFAACTDCHRDPHKGTFAPACTRCHTEETWLTKKVDHERTAYPLAGKHAAVACALCHKKPALEAKPAAATCATCHPDVHRGEFTQDCKACHTEKGFEGAPFDHAKTAFPLAGKHLPPVKCTGCHKNIVTAGLPLATRVVDFRGLKTACVSCHADPHRPELGPGCEPCHSARTFKVPTFTHAEATDFFGGQHTPVPCAKCHTPAGPATSQATGSGRLITARFRNTPTRCVECHEDVHLGQLNRECQACHSLALAKFKLPAFDHAATRYALAGKHQAAACATCHKRETAAFPDRRGTAVRYTGLPRECQGCHRDVHLGQFDRGCQGCHTAASFKVATYTHLTSSWQEVFRGRHKRAPCADCHKPQNRRYPAGPGTAVHYAIDAACTACHEDTHRGALGTSCIDCHRP